jgi:hypothetical protein
MWKRIGSAAGLVAVMCAWMPGIRPALGQQLIASFENNLSSTVGATWEGDGIANSKFVTVGATEGNTALSFRHPPSWTIQLILKGGLPLAQAVANHDFLLIDVTTQDLGGNNDGWAPAWQQIIPVINSNQGGWQQTQFDFPIAADDGGASAPQTVILDLNTDVSNENNNTLKQNAQAYVASGGGPGTWFELFLPFNGQNQGTPTAKPGDYNDDTVVNAADYVVWRENLGGTSLPNESVSLGSVDAEDYSEWKQNFGIDYTWITTIIDNVRLANAGSGAFVSGATPEPTSAILALLGALTLGTRRRIRP